MTRIRSQYSIALVIVLTFGVAAFAFPARAQWAEPKAQPPAENPPGFVWLQGGSSIAAQEGTIDISGALGAAAVKVRDGVFIYGAAGETGMLQTDSTGLLLQGSADFHLKNAAGDTYVESSRGFLYAYGGAGVVAGPALYLQGPIVAMPSTQFAPVELTLSTAAGGSAVPRIRVSGSTGNVGIGGAPDATHRVNVAGKLNATELCIAGTCQTTWPSGGAAGTFVQLQSASPGTADTGNFNITGTGRMGGAVLAGNGVTVPTLANLNATVENFYLDGNGNVQIRLDADDATDGVDNLSVLRINNGTNATVLNVDENGSLNLWMPQDGSNTQQLIRTRVVDGKERVGIGPLNANNNSADPQARLHVEGDVLISGGNSATGSRSELWFKKAYGNSTAGKIGIRAPTTLADNAQLALTLPSTLPTVAGQVLQSTTGGDLSWKSVVGLQGATPATTETGGFAVSGQGRAGSLAVTGAMTAGSASITGALTVGSGAIGTNLGVTGTLTAGTVNATAVDATSVSGRTLLADGAPTGAGVLAGPLTVNPQSASAGTTLFGVAVGGVERLRLDEDGKLTAGAVMIGQSSTTYPSIVLSIDQSTQNNGADVMIIAKGRDGGSTDVTQHINNWGGNFIWSRGGRDGTVEGMRLDTGTGTLAVSGNVTVGAGSTPVALLYESGNARIKGYGDVNVQLDADASATVNKFAVKDSGGTNDVFSVDENGVVTTTSSLTEAENAVIFNVRAGSSSGTKFRVYSSGAIGVGREQLRTSCDVAAGAYGSCTQLCSAGLKVLGGGCNSGAGVAGISLLDSMPRLGGDGWTCGVYNGSLINPLSITVTAICSGLTL